MGGWYINPLLPLPVLLFPLSLLPLYNPTEKSWSIKCHMKTPRSLCLVAALPSNKLMIVGGITQGLGLHDEVTNEVKLNISF